MNAPIQMAVRSHAGVSASAASDGLVSARTVESGYPLTRSCHAFAQRCAGVIGCPAARKLFSINARARSRATKTSVHAVQPTGFTMPEPALPQPKRFFKALAQCLPLLLLLVGGCASVDTTNTDTRPWGRASEFERHEEWRRSQGLFGWLLSCPEWEQQRNEEWLQRH